jgi:hypothetical protein
MATFKQIRPYVFTLLIIVFLLMLTLSLRAQAFRNVQSDRQFYRTVGRATDANREQAAILAAQDARTKLIALIETMAPEKQGIEAVGYQASSGVAEQNAGLKRQVLEKAVAAKAAIYDQDVDYKRREGLHYAAAAIQISRKDVEDAMKTLYFKQRINEVGDRKDQMEPVLQKETGKKKGDDRR